MVANTGRLIEVLASHIDFHPFRQIVLTDNDDCFTFL
jgi:hypothetical protein